MEPEGALPWAVGASLGRSTSQRLGALQRTVGMLWAAWGPLPRAWRVQPVGGAAAGLLLEQPGGGWEAGAQGRDRTEAGRGRDLGIVSMRVALEAGGSSGACERGGGEKRVAAQLQDLG